MKRSFLVSLLLICFVCVHGQTILDYRMCDVYMGKVKAVRVLEPEQQRSEFVFSEDGKVRAMHVNDMQMEYEWSEDGEIICTLSGGNLSEPMTDYMYVNEYTPSYCDFDAGPANFKIWFRENGTCSKKEMTQGDNKLTVIYHYQNESDTYPYMIENMMGEQSEEILIEIEENDSVGNPIVITQSNKASGMSYRMKREIEYF